LLGEFSVCGRREYDNRSIFVTIIEVAIGPEGGIAILGTRSGTLEWVTPVIYLRGRESRLFSLPGKSPPLVGAV
jgi:hypothetical protein